MASKDQKIIRFSLSWMVNETYSFIARPTLTEADAKSMSILLQLFDDLYDAGVADLLLSEGEADVVSELPHQEVPSGSLGRLKFAVESFLDQVGPMRGEFKIITGLPLMDGESLLLRLREVIRNPEPETN